MPTEWKALFFWIFLSQTFSTNFPQILQDM